MNPRRIFRDVSDPSILVTCVECPWWFAMRFDVIEAYEAGEAHEVREHGVTPHDAARARALYEARHG